MDYFYTSKGLEIFFQESIVQIILNLCNIILILVLDIYYSNNQLISTLTFLKPYRLISKFRTKSCQNHIDYLRKGEK